MIEARGIIGACTPKAQCLGQAHLVSVRLSANSRRRQQPAKATANTELINHSTNGGGDSSFVPRLACLRWHDDGAGVGVLMVGERSLPDAVTLHSSIK